MIYSLITSKVNTCNAPFFTATLLALLIAMSGCDAPSDSLDVQGQSSKPGKVVTAESMGYEIKMTDLTKEFNDSESYAYSINEKGQIVGELSSQAMLWEEGNITVLDALDQKRYELFFANDINDKGQIVGTSFNSNGEKIPVTWIDGKISAICNIEAGGLNNVALSINNKGQILSTRKIGVDVPPIGEDPPIDRDSSLYISNITYNNKTRELKKISLVNDNIRDRSSDRINEKNQIAGQSSKNYDKALFWDNGKITELGDLGSGRAHALGINDKGQIVGYSYTANERQHAFLWENGKMTDLGRGRATAINNKGQIVGTRQVEIGERDYHAVMWEDGKIIDLGTLGGKYSRAHSINEKGQIVGWSETDILSAGYNYYGRAVLWEIKKIE